MARPDVQLGPGETLDRLSGAWWILQLERGHRFSTDDVLTAWTGLEAIPRASSVLELGAGIGSIGLMVLHELPADATLTSLEVQRISVELARRTSALNGVDHRVDQRLGDLREDAPLADCGRFPLVLANPPYLSPDQATASPHPQRAAARLELHGDVFHYCARAARHLCEDGRFCFCHSARDPRPEHAIQAAGLQLLGRREVTFRQGQPPMLALFECGHRGDARTRPPVTIRDAQGRWTDTWRRIRQRLSLPRDRRLFGTREASREPTSSPPGAGSR
jgi:tRNA1Val (adenine37-N6)-methyltransferase